MKKTKFNRKKLNNILEQMNININNIENIKETNNIYIPWASFLSHRERRSTCHGICIPLHA